MNSDEHECQRLRELLAPYAALQGEPIDPQTRSELQAALSVDDFGLADGMRLRGYITDFLSSRVTANELITATLDLRQHTLAERQNESLGVRRRLSLEP